MSSSLLDRNLAFRTIILFQEDEAMSTESDELPVCSF